MWACGTSYVGMWYLLCGHVVPLMWACGTSYVGMWYLLCGHVVPLMWACGTSYVGMWYLLCGHVVPLMWACGTSYVGMWYLLCDLLHVHNYVHIVKDGQQKVEKREKISTTNILLRRWCGPQGQGD